jgi:hypothetical protein
LNLTIIPKLAFVPNLFQQNSSTQRVVILMEQNEINSSYYRRVIQIYLFQNQFISQSKYKSIFIHNDSLSLLKFLDEIPNNYFVNAILNYHSTECLYCNHSVYLFLTVNGIPKYCQTLMDRLSINV